MWGFIIVIFKGIKDITLWVLLGASLLGLMCKWIAHWHIFESSKDALEMMSWQIPLVIISSASIFWVIVVIYYWFEKKKTGGMLKYHDKIEALTQRVDELEKEIQNLKAKAKHTRSRAKKK